MVPAVAPNPIRWIRFVRAHRWMQDHMSKYLDGDLDERDRERAERHIHECPECSELLASLRNLLGALREVRGRARPEVADAVLTGVRERLEKPSDDA